MTTVTKLYKLASENVNYSFDWTPEVGGNESISSAEVELLAGSVVLSDVAGTPNSSDLSGNVQTVWVSGGSVGESVFVIRVTIGQRIESRKYRIAVSNG